MAVVRDLPGGGVGAGEEETAVISTRLMWINVAWYLVLAGLGAWDARWPVVLYWLGAACLTLGVILGMR